MLPRSIAVFIGAGCIQGTGLSVPRGGIGTPLLLIHPARMIELDQLESMTASEEDVAGVVSMESLATTLVVVIAGRFYASLLRCASG